MITRLALSLAIVSLLCGAEPAADKKTQAIINAYRHDDPMTVYKLVTSATSHLKGPQLAKFDASLQAAKLPASTDLLGEIRMKLIQQNRADYLPVPKGKERVQLLKYLQGKIAEFAERTRASGEEIQKQQSSSQRDFENQLWDLHVLRNELLTGERLAQYSALLVKDKAGNALGSLSEADKEFIKTTAGGDTFKPLQLTDLQITEFEMVLRLARLENGLEALKSPKLTKERFMAAYATVIDGNLLIDYLQARADSIQQAVKSGGSHEPHPVLDDPDLAEDVKMKLAEAKGLAGNLATKSKLFFEGLHWWLRGRYGSGTDMWGLLKSELAVKNPQTSVWLFMPRDLRLVPTDAEVTSPSAIPAVDRRFLYTWAWQDRKVETQLMDVASSPKENTTQRTLSFSMPVNQFW